MDISDVEFIEKVPCVLLPVPRNDPNFVRLRLPFHFGEVDPFENLRQGSRRSTETRPKKPAPLFQRKLSQIVARSRLESRMTSELPGTVKPASVLGTGDLPIPLRTLHKHMPGMGADVGETVKPPFPVALQKEGPVQDRNGCATSLPLDQFHIFPGIIPLFGCRPLRNHEPVVCKNRRKFLFKKTRIGKGQGRKSFRFLNVWIDVEVTGHAKRINFHRDSGKGNRRRGNL